MSTGTEKVIMTPAEYKAEGLRVREIIAGYHLCLDATIDDYPIGRRDRGKCRLQVERAKGKGYRTVRTTTDKYGRWCKPKKSTFRDAVTVVVDNVESDRPVQWLTVGIDTIYLMSPNGEGTVLLKAPYWTKPRRVDHHYTVTSTSGMYDESPVTTTEAHVSKADPVELCDSWDAWYDEYMILRTIVLEAWKDQ